MSHEPTEPKHGIELKAHKPTTVLREDRQGPNSAAAHVLTINSLHDAQAFCSCGWSYSFTGKLTRAAIQSVHAGHLQDYLVKVSPPEPDSHPMSALQLLQAIADYWGEGNCEAPVYPGAYLTSRDVPISQLVTQTLRAARPEYPNPRAVLRENTRRDHSQCPNYQALTRLLADYEQTRHAMGWQFCGNPAIEEARQAIAKHERRMREAQ